MRNFCELLETTALGQSCPSGPPRPVPQNSPTNSPKTLGPYSQTSEHGRIQVPMEVFVAASTMSVFWNLESGWCAHTSGDARLPRPTVSALGIPKSWDRACARR